MTSRPGTMLNDRPENRPNDRSWSAKSVLRPGTLLVAFTSFAAMLASSASADVIGNVILQDYRGATATPDGAQEAKPIYFQDQVSALDTVATGDGGATSMRFLDETRFDVGPNAMVKLDDFVFDPMSAIGAGKISMAVGAFRYVGGKMKSDENVKLITPTATMTIRGTELVIFVGLDGTTEVNVVDGAIDVQVCDKAEVVPATIPLLITLLALEMGIAVVVEAILSFVGLGVKPDQVAWGQMIADGREAIYQAPANLLAPVAAIFVTVAGFNLLGDGLRRTLDVRLVEGRG